MSGAAEERARIIAYLRESSALLKAEAPPDSPMMEHAWALKTVADELEAEQRNPSAPR